MSIYSDAEITVRKLLEKEYQTLLPETALQTGTSTTGKPLMHKFDGASDDRNIVFEVKSNGIDPNCNSPMRRYSSNIKWVLFGDIYMLSLIEAKIKLFVLPHKELFEKFTQDSDGILPKGIQVIHRDIVCL